MEFIYAVNKDVKMLCEEALTTAKNTQGSYEGSSCLTIIAFGRGRDFNPYGEKLESNKIHLPDGMVDGVPSHTPQHVGYKINNLVIELGLTPTPTMGYGGYHWVRGHSFADEYVGMKMYLPKKLADENLITENLRFQQEVISASRYAEMCCEVCEGEEGYDYVPITVW